MSQFTIVPATATDVPALNQLVNGAYRGDSSRQGWTTEADLLDGTRIDEATIRAMLAHPNATILTYRLGSELAGCVYLETNPDSLYLGMLTVSPMLQAAGIGRALLTAAETYARERNRPLIRMTVLPQRTELIAWYQRRGYRLTGDTEPFPTDNQSLGLPRQPLSFVVLEKEIGSETPATEAALPFLANA